MTKTEKRLDKAIRHTLTHACEEIKLLVEGFSWLTHHVDFKKLNDIKILCYFESRDAFNHALHTEQVNQVVAVIVSDLKTLDIVINPKAISFHYDK